MREKSYKINGVVLQQLLNKHFCKKNQNIPNETEKIVNFLFSYYKSMGTISCHSNQSSYPIGTKNTTFSSPYLKMLYVKYEKNRPTASEEMSFENVDRRTDGLDFEPRLAQKVCFTYSQV